jgi:hypothetical protein
MPSLPVYPEQLLKRLDGTPEASSCRLAYQDLRKQRAALSGLRIQYLNALRESLYRLLLQSASLRSSSMREAVRKGDYPILQQPVESFADVLREVRIVPYMWMAGVSMGLFTLHEKVALGVKGVLDIAKDCLLVVAIVVVPFLVSSSARPLLRMLAWIQDALMSARSQLSLAQSLAIQLLLVRPYVPWIVALCGVWIAGRLAESAGLKGLGHLVPYANYYIGYRMFRIFLSSSITLGGSFGDAYAQPLEREKVHRTVKRFGILLFLALPFCTQWRSQPERRWCAG